jgi:hypothetical protein
VSGCSDWMIWKAGASAGHGCDQLHVVCLFIICYIAVLVFRSLDETKYDKLALPLGKVPTS